jgi:hypothetical protein
MLGNVNCALWELVHWNPVSESSRARACDARRPLMVCKQFFASLGSQQGPNDNVIFEMCFQYIWRSCSSRENLKHETEKV